jgi:hypothetical protein
VKIKVIGSISIVLLLLLSACSQSGSYSGGADSNVSECQSLADKYWSEYQAYKDARAANNNVEDEAVMSHYYASSDYYSQFMNLDCESQGYSLDADGSSSLDSESESVYSEPQIVLDILNRLTSVSSESWSIDQANDLTGSGTIGVLLSDQCGVWIFDSTETIQNAYDRGLFSYSTNWFGTDGETGYGIMLMAESRNYQCVQDVMTVVNWSYLD